MLDNLDLSHIQSFILKSGVSKKGNSYQRFEIVFSNGYKFDTWLTSEQYFVLKTLVK